MQLFVNSSLLLKLHKIYFVLITPIVFCLVFITPPFQVPDESLHFFRIVQIASGHLYGKLNKEGKAGGDIPISVQEVTLHPGFYKMRDEFNTKIDVLNSSKSNLSSIKWQSANSFIPFPSSVVYFFFAYLPSVIGILLGKLFGANVLTSFYLGRLCNALAAICLSTLSIKLISRGKCLAFALLALPMTLFEFASLSQDAVIISLSALGVGLTNLLLDSEDKPNQGGLLFGIAFLFCMITIGKPAYFPLLFVLPVILFKNKYLFKLSIVFTVLSCLAIFGWMIAVTPLFHPQETTSNPVLQLQFITKHSFYIPYIIVNTIQHSEFLLRAFIGKIGWQEYTALPISWCTLFYVGLLFTLIIDYYYSSAEHKYKTIIILLCLSSILLIYITAYLLWTTVQGSYIYGMQGRYWIPIILCMTLLFGYVNKLELSIQNSNVIPSILLSAIFLFGITNVATIFFILMRYYY